MHIMIQIGLPNWRAARNRYRKRLSVRTGVRAAVALEKVRYRTGSYPAAAPAEILDPITSKPFLYRAQGDRWLLYGPDVDGRDDGCNPDKDAVVWQ
ncbi:MAG: hypothetical protein HY303_09870 [Candidatus Wallbacteria bacterium]|nr:hypothetical protein [Candidatus Wallbacteria bacterium]